jgi:hypothetical protein
MGRMYTASFAPTAQTAAVDAFELLAPGDSILRVHRIRLWQTTDLGDAAEEVLNVTMTRAMGSFSSGSGGTTPDIHPHDDGDSAFGGTIEARNTTQASVGTGTLEVLDRAGWNIRIPFELVYTPEERPVITPSDTWVLSVSAPADSVTWGASITFEEIGG